MRLGETAKGESFKARAYKKAIDALKRLDGPILTAETVKDVDGVGKKIYEKITEIVATGGLKSADHAKYLLNLKQLLKAEFPELMFRGFVIETDGLLHELVQESVSFSKASL